MQIGAVLEAVISDICTEESHKLELKLSPDHKIINNEQIIFRTINFPSIYY